jgi:hypothetical protein
MYIWKCVGINQTTSEGHDGRGEGYRGSMGLQQPGADQNGSSNGLLKASVNNNTSAIPSQLSLLFCIAVDDMLQPSFHALLCTRRVGGTVFLSPTVSRAVTIPSDLDPMMEFQNEDCKVNIYIYIYVIHTSVYIYVYVDTHVYMYI